MEESKKEYSSHPAEGGWNAFVRLQPAAMILVVAGWAQFANYFRFWLVRSIPLSFVTCKTLEVLTNGLVFIALAAIACYLWLNRSRFREVLTRQLAVLWLSWFLSMVATNLIIKHSLGHIVFELQHTLFMLYTALAVLMTGILVRKPSLWKGGILFVALALASTFFQLKTQMGMEAAGWLLGVATPGHILLRDRS